MSKPWIRIATCMLALSGARAYAQEAPANADDANAIAEKLSNPVASLISVPLQFNYDSDIGPDQRGHKLTLNIQPVIPISLNEDWNMISRTILPVISQGDTQPGSGSQSGVGDITQSLFFSPKKPTTGGYIWGIGPAFLIPTATDDLLGSKKWGMGPTALLLRQTHGWTFGFLANQIWSVASVKNNRDRAPLSTMFLQPFLAYNTPTAWTYGVNLESSYDWHQHQYTVPINFNVSKLVRFGKLPVSFGGGARYWISSTENGPHQWGFRFTATMVFPE